MTISQTPHILLLEALPSATLETLKQHFTLHDFTTQEALAPIAPHIRAVITSGAAGIAPEIMAALPALEIIAVNGVGLDKIDLAETHKRGIPVTVTTDISTNDVADMAMLLLLTLKRNFRTNEDFLLQGHWRNGKLPPLARSLNKRKLGVAGFGRIGQAITRRALACDMDVAYFSGHERPQSPLRFEPNLTKLAEWADILVLSLSANPDTFNIVDASVLKALGKDGVLINIARGSVIDEAALLTALKTNTIAGAGLDVFQNEPRIHEDFFTLKNVTLQPHLGSATLETRLDMGQNIIDNLLAHFNGQELITPVP